MLVCGGKDGASLPSLWVREASVLGRSRLFIQSLESEFSEVACIAPVLKGRRMADRPGPLLLASGRGVAQLVSCGDVYVLDFYEEVRARRGGVDKMAVQIAPFPGVSRPLAYSAEALSITRFWR